MQSFPLANAAVMAKSTSAVAQFEAALNDTKKPSELKLPEELAQTPLTKADAAKAAALLWKKHAEAVKPEREAELKSGVLKLGDRSMPFVYKKFGEAPAKGHSLWISMHGGGGAPKAVNDRQWENQKRLYKLNEGIYLVPRAPTDTWDLWHQGHVDAMYSRLIEDMVIVEGVDPDRVYIMGYSAGGDGVFQLAPRMADQLAAAAMMAGHPNETQPLGLRNLPFSLQMGGNDAAYGRNKVAQAWADQLDKLHKTDPGGYVHFVKIYEGKGHWMDGEDKVAIPWMEKFSRNLNPDRVSWRQDDVIHTRFYWLGQQADKARAGQELVVSRKGQDFAVEKAEGVDEFQLVLSDDQANLDQPVKVLFQNKVIAEVTPSRTLGTILATFSQRPDQKQMAPAIIPVKLAK
ncbi:MAG: alpha/beta hydrolase [Isosphaeraceae bacterium]